MREQIAADENFYRIRDEVAAAERRWRDNGKPDDRLIASGLPLAEAESLVRDFKDELPEDLFADVRRRVRARRRAAIRNWPTREGFGRNKES